MTKLRKIITGIAMAMALFIAVPGCVTTKESAKIVETVQEETKVIYLPSTVPGIGIAIAIPASMPNFFDKEKWVTEQAVPLTKNMFALVQRTLSIPDGGGPGECYIVTVRVQMNDGKPVFTVPMIYWGDGTGENARYWILKDGRYVECSREAHMNLLKELVEFDNLNEI